MDEEYKKGQVLLYNKPLFWSSFDLVYHVRKLFPGLKVGHAGTLDPMASGLMVICTGKQTKNISTIQNADKAYAGIMALGGTTASLDLEQVWEPQNIPAHITLSDIENASKNLIGPITQLPPVYSALKINGERSFFLTNKGEEVQLKPREVNIFQLNITKWESPFIHFQVECSKGTYIRALARDLGILLGTQGCLVKLQRTRIGEFELTQARRDFDDQIFGKGKSIRNRVTTMHQNQFDLESLFLH